MGAVSEKKPDQQRPGHRRKDSRSACGKYHLSGSAHTEQMPLSRKRKASQPSALKGRTFDLKAAFKQLGIEPSDLPLQRS